MYTFEQLLNLDQKTAQERGVEHTPREIAIQTDVWPDTVDRIGARRDALLEILDQIKKGAGQLIFAGAGSSDFVGRSVVDLIKRRLGIPSSSRPTTEITTHPDRVFLPAYPTVLVSVARSGNSPESTATFDLASRAETNVRHIIITCNNEGELAARGRETGGGAVNVVLDPRTNDRGLAMTCSFTNMVIAGQAMAHLNDLGDYRRWVGDLAGMARRILEGEEAIRSLAALDFGRAVFLGSSTNLGAARESALKLQELTDGQIMTAYDTYLGFRHGPEAVVNPQTLVVGFVSSEPYVRRYEADLLRELDRKDLGNSSVAVGRDVGGLEDAVDTCFELDPGGQSAVEDDLLAPVMVVFGQLLGLFKSLDLGKRPDNPSERGAIHRVVEGVTIYPYTGSGESE